jgi:hypothetical protein
MAQRSMFLIAAAIVAISAVAFAGGETVQRTTVVTERTVPAPPPYPPELEARYQSMLQSSGMAWYKAQPAIPFSPCGPLAPNVRDKFGFGPHVDGFDFEPGGRLNPVQPWMVGGALLLAGYHHWH